MSKKIDSLANIFVSGIPKIKDADIKKAAIQKAKYMIIETHVVEKAFQSLVINFPSLNEKEISEIVEIALNSRTVRYSF